MKRMHCKDIGRLASVVFSLVCLLTVVPIMAQESAGEIEPSGSPVMEPVPSTGVELIRQRLRNLEETAIEAVQPLPEGESKELRAIVMYTHGNVQWRGGPDGSWSNTTVDDELESGAMIRTGLKSSVTLRVGLNATVLIDSNARVTLPRIMHEGDRLETAVEVTRGQVDIKVNRVGLTNDFSVVTPTGALAVKGTGFGVNQNAYGTTVVGSRDNMMNAIEMHYYATKLAYHLSGGAVSSSSQENPTLAALMETAPPPSTNKTEEQDVAAEDSAVGQAISNTNPISQTIRIDLAIQQENASAEINTYIEEQFLEDLDRLAEELAQQEIDEEIIEEIVEEIEEEVEEEVEGDHEEYYDVFLLDGFYQHVAGSTNLERGEVAAAIYFDLVTEDQLNPGMNRIMPKFSENLFYDLGYDDTGQHLQGIAGEIIAYGDSIDEIHGGGDGYIPTQEDLRVILTIVDEFCKATFQTEFEIALCRDCYGRAVDYAFNDSDPPSGYEDYFEYLVENLEGQGGIGEP